MLHPCFSTLHILSHACGIALDSGDFRCVTRLIKDSFLAHFTGHRHLPGTAIVVDTLMGLSADHQFLSDKKEMLRALEEKLEHNTNTGNESEVLRSEERGINDRMDTLLEKLETKVIGDDVFKRRYAKLEKGSAKEYWYQPWLNLPFRCWYFFLSLRSCCTVPPHLLIDVGWPMCRSSEIR